ncbi:MAG: DinB family protein [Promethearchaeota archaeon]
MNNKKDTLERAANLSPRVATWYSQMEKVRKRLLEKVEKIADKALDFTPKERNFETIGTLLLHIAAVEWSWIFEDIDGKEMDFEEWKYAFALRPSVNLPQLTGQGKQFYLNRLHKVRDEVYQRLIRLDDQDLDQIIEDSSGYQVSIEWILFHIIEHEAMHVGQIGMLSRLYNLQTEKDA